MKALQWQDMDPAVTVTIYQTILNRIQNFADQTLERDKQHDLMRHFLASLPLGGMLDFLEYHSYQRLYRMFFNDWLLLDYRSKPGGPTMAELTLQNLKNTLDQREVQALTNLVKSYVSVYRILSFGNGQAYLKNLVIPKHNYKITTSYEGFMADDILVTRLLPGPSDWLLLEPWILLLPLNEKLLAKSLRQVMKEAGYHKRDFSRFCKKKTILLLQVINQEVVEAEKEVVAMAENIPFCPDWHEATVSDSQRIMDLLQASDGFQKMNGNEEGRFLFFDPENPGRLSWSYILVEEDRMALCVPPQEDSSLVFDALTQVIAGSGEGLKFTKLDSSHERAVHYNNRIIEDLSRFLQNHEEMIDDILIPRQYTQYCQEQSRSDFFAKLSLLLGERLQNLHT
ncbi:MAG: hypothetical protein ACM3UW_09080, partial [Bacillota bacterium]